MLIRLTFGATAFFFPNNAFIDQLNCGSVTELTDLQSTGTVLHMGGIIQLSLML
jgi:hypothetical protein